MKLLTHKTLLKERRTVVLLLLLLAFFPFFLWYYSSWRCDETRQALEEIRHSSLALRTIASGQMMNRTLMAHFRQRDPLFLQKYVETYALLKREIHERENDAFGTYLPIPHEKKERMRFLLSGENSFSFLEGKVQQSKQLKETLEIQTKPVEMDTYDLETVLQALEGKEESVHDEAIQEMLEKRPLFLMESAELERKKRFDREVWQVKLRLIKREFELDKGSK
jgi:hypothetical protein